ncbi:sensor histidine kinase [Lysinibacillus irui]|uniref:sensor histidine kinase n=1 Tax=Lysinibacillus irui TaxID=2998077 RepID=UPI002AD2F39E|nr:HAMP domain-containing sensor histidine kinase [Lysinibacillus irui]MEA0563453.1 HAMP domain-containing sensor histidine kinase [Lysinibacillus irui]
MKMKKITYKLFLITSLILFSFAILIYLAIYFFLPTFYEKYKTNELQIGLQELLEKSQHLTLQEAKSLLDRYANKNNAMLYIQSENGTIVYPFYLVTDENVIIQKSRNIMSAEPEDSYSIVQEIRFNDGTYDLHVQATLQPIDEASKVLLLFLPYISLIVIIIGIGSAYLSSRFLTRPILYINQGAQKMANLDFSEKIEVRSTDELGELSNSLNNMSINLQQTMFDLQKANHQLKSDIEKEREIETKRREFFATVAHELKTPLTVIKGYVEGMLYNIGPYQDRDKYLKENHQIIERMEKIVREILSVSKLEPTTLKPTFEAINLSELIFSITKSLDFFAIQKNIQIIQDIESNLFVSTDRNLLEKACKNIIHNAIMYSPSGEKVHIQLTKNPQQSNILFQVINTGVQINDEDIQQIFQPFYRVEKSRNRNTGGSGLGLFIVKQIFEALSISYTMNNLEQNVMFSATIPLR